MTQANFEPLKSAAHPQRQPYVRSLSYVDGKGPTPYEFFDQYQDHLGAYAGALLGRSHAVDSDEFTEAYFRSGFFGKMKSQQNLGGVTYSAAITPDQIGVHGAGSALGSTDPWRFAVGGINMGLGADFLLTVKLKIIAPQNLDIAEEHGLFVAVGPQHTFPNPPAFVAGGDADTWRIRSGSGPDIGGDLQDTGIPCLAGVWYGLQISRVRGAVRWFVNGQQAKHRDTPDGPALEGQYYPYPLLNGQKWITSSRWRPGAAGEGIIVDSCHLLAQRGAP